MCKPFSEPAGVYLKPVCERGLVTSEWSQALLKPRAHLASYPVALCGLYGLLAGGRAGAHAVYVLTVTGMAMVRGCTVAPAAQGIPSTNTIARVRERTGPAGHRGRHRRDHSPKQVAFMSWTWGDKRFFSSCRRLRWNQRRNCPNSRAFQRQIQRCNSHLRYTSCCVLLHVFIAVWGLVTVVTVTSMKLQSFRLGA